MNRHVDKSLIHYKPVDLSILMLKTVRLDVSRKASMDSGKSAFVLFCCMNSNVQYRVSTTSLLSLPLVCLY